jgi:uncharacterized protein with PQ loop repeat
MFFSFYILTHTLSQFIENYKRKSGESLSMTFLVIWLAGDIFNLLGVIMQNLLITMVKIQIFRGGVHELTSIHLVCLSTVLYRFRYLFDLANIPLPPKTSFIQNLFRNRPPSSS